jgi:hypothetical protein
MYVVGTTVPLKLSSSARDMLPFDAVLLHVCRTAIRGTPGTAAWTRKCVGCSGCVAPLMHYGQPTPSSRHVSVGQHIASIAAVHVSHPPFTS